MGRRVPGAGDRHAVRQALDRRFDTLRDAATQWSVPSTGWVRAIREALGMSAAELGTRMGIVETSVLRLEQNEQVGKVRMDTLRRAADALECDVVYALRPRRPLQDMVDARAHHLARTFLATSERFTQLVPSPATQGQLDELIELIREAPGLWRDG